MAKAAEPEMKKKEETQFAKFINYVFQAAKKVEVSEVTKAEYEILAKKRIKKPVTFHEILHKILEAEKPKGTIEEYLMALAPQPKKKEGPNPEQIPNLVKGMIAEKVREMPELKESAMIYAVKLAALLDLAVKDPEKLAIKKWVESEAVV
jgi:hypothetical protein